MITDTNPDIINTGLTLAQLRNMHLYLFIFLFGLELLSVYNLTYNDNKL